MSEIKPLPSTIVEKLEEAGISRESEIFYHQHQWVYQKKLTVMTDFSHCGHPIDELGPFGRNRWNFLQIFTCFFHLDIHPVDASIVLSRMDSKYTITKIGHIQLTEQNQPMGTHSPLAKITLEGAVRSAANIPEKTTHFCWLYPPRRLPVFDDLHSASFDEINLLKIGGFAYFVFDENSAAQPQVVQINSLIVTGSNGLVFDGPFIWNSSFNDQLWSQNRFHVSCLDPGWFGLSQQNKSSDPSFSLSRCPLSARKVLATLPLSIPLSRSQRRRIQCRGIRHRMAHLSICSMKITFPIRTTVTFRSLTVA